MILKDQADPWSFLEDVEEAALKAARDAHARYPHDLPLKDAEQEAFLYLVEHAETAARRYAQDGARYVGYQVYCHLTKLVSRDRQSWASGNRAELVAE